MGHGDADADADGDADGDDGEGDGEKEENEEVKDEKASTALVSRPSPGWENGNISRTPFFRNIGVACLQQRCLSEQLLVGDME